MTKRVVFIGSAGCGKSTIAAEVFVILKKKGLNVELITEFIRSDIQENGPMESIWEQYRTLNYQRMAEDNVPKSVEWAIIDSGCLTPYFYSCLYASKANERERLILSDMHKFLINDLYKKRYDYVFFLPGEIRYDDDNSVEDILSDGTRYQTHEELKILDEYMKLFFIKMFKINNIHEINGPIEGRLDKVLKILEKDESIKST